MNEVAAFLKAKEVPKKARKIKPVTDKIWQVRYQQSYQNHFKVKYPGAYKAGGFVKLTFPDTSKGNGLNRAIENFLTWEGYRATRVSSAGRMVDGKFIHSTTRSGAADVSSTIKGRSCQWEGKAGNDTPRSEQLREQIIERNAGGVYEFIHNMTELYFYYDQVLNGEI